MDEIQSPMVKTGFQLATGIVFFLTLLCIGINALGWVRIRGFYQLLTRAASIHPGVAERKIAGVAQLTWLIRLEAFYYTVLLAYAITYPGVLAMIPIFLVVLYHWLGWMANEWTATTRNASNYLKAGGAIADSFRSKSKMAIYFIGVLDAVEFAILGYISFKTGHLI